MPKIDSTINSMKFSSSGSSIGSKRKAKGCLTCRQRRVKCDETTPICSACNRLSKQCEWENPSEPKIHVKISRRSHSTACEACRSKKLKCEGSADQGACTRCQSTGIICTWTKQENKKKAQADDHERSDAPKMQKVIQISEEVEFPPLEEIQTLTEIYFSKVHHFAFLTFIHPPRFKDELTRGGIPPELTLMVIASALRFGCVTTPDDTFRADQWADEAIALLLPKIYQGFGAVKLMALVLAQYYEYSRGNFNSAWLMSSNCVRMVQMMSLHTFDRTYPTKIRLAPLLTRESLRRLAWSVFYFDSIIDGGRYGCQVVDENVFRIPLPCSEENFLAEIDYNDQEDHLYPPYSATSSMGISGHLIRTAACRRRALHFASTITNREIDIRDIELRLNALEEDIKSVLESLPEALKFERYKDNLWILGERKSMFTFLHVLRLNLYVILGRTKIIISSQLEPKRPDLEISARFERLSIAIPTAEIIAENLKDGNSNVIDCGIPVFAYVALEILIFESQRLNGIKEGIHPKAPHILEAISPLLAALRSTESKSYTGKVMYIEAVYRLLNCGFGETLTETDLASFAKEYEIAGQDEAEYDFRDFRFAKLERLRKAGKSLRIKNDTQNETLFDTRVEQDDVQTDYRTHSPAQSGTKRDVDRNAESSALDPDPFWMEDSFWGGTEMNSQPIDHESWAWLMDEMGQTINTQLL